MRSIEAVKAKQRPSWSTTPPQLRTGYRPNGTSGADIARYFADTVKHPNARQGQADLARSIQTAIDEHRLTPEQIKNGVDHWAEIVECFDNPVEHLPWIRMEFTDWMWEEARFMKSIKTYGKVAS